MPELTDMQAIITTAQEAVGPSLLSDGRFFAVVVPDGAACQVIDMEDHLDTYRDTPRRKVGKVAVVETKSFVAYLAKHGLEDTELWADLERATVTAVINAPTATEPRFSDHTLTLRLRLTDDWSQWAGKDRTWMNQTTFAEHVEDHLPNFVDPPGATMLEVAQSFQAHTRVTFESSKRLGNGETQLVFKEDVEAKAGRKGDISIPGSFTLGLMPYESGDAYRITARLRYRIVDGALTLSYVLDRPREVLKAAFDGVLDDIRSETDRDIWHGTA